MNGIPHDFPFFSSPDGRVPVFVCGAGFSRDLIPLPGVIVRTHRASAERAISASAGATFTPVTGDPDGNLPDTLYLWADEAIEFLRVHGDPCPQLTLASLLGITSGADWLAGVDAPITRLKARHRVVARFARESKWRALWTFNWDCHLEAALRGVGITDDPMASPQPWPARFQRLLGLEDYGVQPQVGTIQVHKPHGCVKRLRDAEQDIRLGKKTPNDFGDIKFKIGKTELDAPPTGLPADYQLFRARLLEHFAGAPLVAAGWRAAEPYFLTELEGAQPQIRQYPDANTRLSVADLEFNAQGHHRLAIAYGVTPAQAHVKVEPTGFDQDRLMQWVQAIYTLRYLEHHIGNPARGAEILQLRTVVTDTGDPRWAIEWSDFFLPSWVRLCWREGLVQARNAAGVLLDPAEIRLEDDWHVPIAQTIPDRPELISAAYLLLGLQAHGSTWDCQKAPGCLYDKARSLLVVPVPAWGDPGKRNWLNSIKPFLRQLHSVLSICSEVKVLPMIAGDSNPTADQSDHALRAIRVSASSLGLASGTTLSSTSLAALAGGAV
ncbi:MAG TPA: hypothetical protein VKS43_14250 [Burkholderiales bacterium]|nr:hypothetical protein [Burkholderiales bacterium]